MKSSKEWPTKELPGSPRRGHTYVSAFPGLPEKRGPQTVCSMSRITAPREERKEIINSSHKKGHADGDSGCVSLIHTTTFQINQLLPGDRSRGLQAGLAKVPLREQQPSNC